MIFSYGLYTPDGKLISRHKSLEKAVHAAKYTKTCKPIVKELEQ